jgi:hypothetical protein
VIFYYESLKLWKESVVFSVNHVPDIRLDIFTKPCVVSRSRNRELFVSYPNIILLLTNIVKIPTISFSTMSELYFHEYYSFAPAV